MHDDRWFVGPPSAPDTYLLVQPLGTGGEGEVWTAERRLSEQGRQRVAVKILADGRGRDGRSWDRHAALLRSVNHPGLVRVLDVFTGQRRHRAGELPGDECRYVVMEHVDGESFLDWIGRARHEPLSHRLRLLTGVAAALDEMHSGRQTVQPVAHGDVKPANIVVRPDGSTVLVDLGLMRISDGTVVAGRTDPYAAPELFLSGATTTPEADRFAFAATVVHAVLGEPPPVSFTNYGPDLSQVAERLRTDPLCAALPSFRHRIVDALATSPAARPASLSGWLATLLADLTPTTVVIGVGHPPFPQRPAAPTPRQTLVEPPPPWTPPAPAAGARRSGVTPLNVAVVLLCLAVLVGALAAAVFGGLRLVERLESPGTDTAGSTGSASSTGTPPAGTAPARPSPPSAPSPAASPAPDDLGRARDFLGGTWQGTYRCRQGLTGLTLTLFVVDDRTVKATFEFYPVASNPDVPRGSFAMEGSYSATNLTLRPDYWLSRPDTYEMIALGATFSPRVDAIRGEVDTAGCAEFAVRKTSDDTRLPPV